MASGFDRLERFFSYKRKASAISTETTTTPSTAPTTPVDPLDGLQFPSPSFIRPKNTRMAARDEVRIKRPDSQSSSTHDTNWSRKASADSGCELLPMPARLPSLDIDTTVELTPMFQGFSFPKPPSSRGDTARSSIDSGSLSVPELSEGPLSWPSFPLTHVDTPPSSDSEDTSLQVRRAKSTKLSIITHQVLPTPETSPDFGSDWHLQADKTVEILDESLYADIHRQLKQSIDAGAPASCMPLDYQATEDPSSPRPSFSGSSLQEPNVCDFFSLDDYNVAEGGLDSCEFSSASSQAETPVTVAPSISSMSFRDIPLLTLEPPSATRPAAAAAFEAARIANRYNFDMLYVVNLWPAADETDHRLSSEVFSPTSDMTGRLLTAYGLDKGPSPFQISSQVHVKVMQSAGWLEYRDEQAEIGEFGRAYACAFYSGSSDDRRSSKSTWSIQHTHANAIDRGIVFAGYRMPDSDGNMPGMNFEELAYLRQDVEALVEMLIDIHVTNQLRQPSRLLLYSEETGPMPS